MKAHLELSSVKIPHPLMVERWFNICQKLLPASSPILKMEAPVTCASCGLGTSGLEVNLDLCRHSLFSGKETGPEMPKGHCPMSHAELVAGTRSGSSSPLPLRGLVACSLLQEEALVVSPVLLAVNGSLISDSDVGVKQWLAWGSHAGFS